MTIRPARVEDAPRLGEIKRAAFDPEFLALTIWRSPRSWRYFEELAAGPPLLWVAEIPGDGGSRIIGYVHLVVLPESWHLNDVAVAPEAQGSGIGAALFRHFEEAATTVPRPALTLDVEEGNALARAWYERRGFVAGEARTIVATANEPVPAPADARLVDVRLEGVESAERDLARRGFGRAWLHANIVYDTVSGASLAARWEFGLLGDDALRLPGRSAEAASREWPFPGRPAPVPTEALLRVRFPDRPVIVETWPEGSTPPDEALSRRTVLRMTRGAA